METRAHLRVAVQRAFRAPQERVFDAWLDPALARRFLFHVPDGEVVQAETDPREGGAFRIVDRRQGKDVDHQGIWLVIDRPRRLVFEFTAEGGPRSRVEIDFAAPDTGGSLVTLTHELHPDWADFAQKDEEGWRTILNGLAAALGEEKAG
ncbi:MAG TPA: SRPBCC domain-containing protein [Candidatus Polarisedimenticolia bacterium]|nr:SRPBCC domain-containing protein [Candidatus Polarisedimenticolia bacterium]